MEERLWCSDLQDGRFRNPVLFADYSDPDVVRVGDTFYMTASSFNYTPGLPILTSRDLVNWKLANYALPVIAEPGYDLPAHEKGVWAPAIRYHQGRFYIYYGMPDEGIFMVSTEHPLGAWEKPVCVQAGKGLIDPCPFWDEDGKAYVVHGYAKSRIGFKSFLGMFEMSYDGTKAVSEDKFIYDGVATQPTIEGPKVYKRAGWYYIFAPAGGVKFGWQTVLRSENIRGPYAEKVVMHQGASPVNGPHQGALVDTGHGEEWFLHFQFRGMYGRIAHLQPVSWQDGWPVIGVNADSEGIGEPCLIYQKPSVCGAGIVSYLPAGDDFAGERLGLQWQWLGNQQQRFYSLTENKGHLRLFCCNESKEKNPVLWQSPNVLTQKLICPYCMAETCLDFAKLQNNQQAGLVMIGNQYVYVAVRVIREEKCVVYVESTGAGRERSEKAEVLCKLPETAKQLWIRLYLEKKENIADVKMQYSCDGNSFEETGKRFRPESDTWVGSKLGLFAMELEDRERRGFADFSYFNVQSR